MKKGKIIGLIVLVLFLGGIGFGVTQIMNDPDKYNGSTNQSKVEAVFYAPSFSRISTDALIDKMGEAKAVEDYPTTTSKGSYDMKIYSYEDDNASIEFIVCDDAVVRVHYFPNEAITFKSENDIMGIFGIKPGQNIKKTADTGTVLKFQAVSDTVGGVDAYDINKKDNTFAYAYVTYNWNYFE